MLEKTLKTGRNVLIKSMSLDDIDDCKDTVRIEFEDGQAKHIGGVNKARTKWIRKGLGGGDFTDWTPNGKDAPDSVLRQLSDEEREELHALVQEAQSVGEEIPSSSNSTSS